MSDLEGRVAIITGGSMGIGRATALRLAERGCSVVVADIEEAAAEKTIAEITSLGRRGLVLQGQRQ